MSNGSNSNSTAVTGTFRIKDGGPDSCLDERVLREIARRLEITFNLSASDSVVRSVTPPSDVTKLWQPVDASSGIPIGQVRQYNAKTREWEKPVPTTESGTGEVALVEKDNLIEKDEEGRLLVPTSVIPRIAVDDNQMLQQNEQGELLVSRKNFNEFKVSEDDCNALTLDSNGRAFVPQTEWVFVGPFGTSQPTTGRLIANAPGTQSTFDLSTIPEFDAKCHRYALVYARIVMKNGSGYSGGSVSSPAMSVRAGTDLERVVIAVDSDTQEGSDTANAIVRLNPADISVFDFWIEENGTPTNWADAKNAVELYIKAFC